MGDSKNNEIRLKWDDTLEWNIMDAAPFYIQIVLFDFFLLGIYIFYFLDVLGVSFEFLVFVKMLLLLY